MDFIDKMRSLYRQAKKQHRDDPQFLAKQLLQHISEQLEVLSVDLESLVEETARGKHKPPDTICQYVIKDRAGNELQSEFHDIDYVSRDDILSCAGYKTLATKTTSLGITLELRQEQCREYDDEDRVRFLVRFSGWD